MGIETAAMIAMAAGTAVSVMGQIEQGKSQKEMYNAQAQQALNEGAYAADAAKAQAEKIRKAGRAQQGEAKAALAASGVKLGEGTPLEVQKSITQNVEEDALSVLIGGKRATDSAQQEAQMLGKAGDNAVKNSYYGAAGTVLQAGATYAKGNWMKTASSAGASTGSAVRGYSSGDLGSGVRIG